MTSMFHGGLGRFLEGDGAADAGRAEVLATAADPVGWWGGGLTVGQYHGFVAFLRLTRDFPLPL